MGAWGAGTFENDTAADWAHGLDGQPNLDFVRLAMEAVLAVGGDDLDADLACEGLAACEVIARLRGNWGERSPYNETVDNWVVAHPLKPDADVVGMAQQVIDRVLGQPSELRELWEEAESDPWIAAVEDLRYRVSN